jgi:UDPglucose 6-dehydrogenase
VTNADAVVLITEWDEFRTLELSEVAKRAARPIFIDGRNLFTAAAAYRAGLDYSGIGCAPLSASPTLGLLQKRPTGAPYASSSAFMP